MLRLLAFLLVAPTVSAAFDHRHTAWNEHGSQVRYSAFQGDRLKLRAYLDALSAVPRQEFDSWAKPQRLAFLINAYNAFTIEHSRNRYVRESNTLEVSKIFDWYGVDFRSGYRGIDSLGSFFARYAANVAANPPEQAIVRQGTARIRFLEYDWALNDTGH